VFCGARVSWLRGGGLRLRWTGEVWGSEFGGEAPEHLEKLDEKYYQPFGARLRQAPKGRKGNQGRVERSHRTDDEEFLSLVWGGRRS